MSPSRRPHALIASFAAILPARLGWWRPLAVLAGALAVPALAAPGNLLALPGPAAESTAALATRKAAEAALPFERPGMSFPGSAYFYMADPAGTALVALPEADPLSVSAEDGRELGALIDVGAPARPFFSARVGLAHARAAECLAQAIWYEAASESEAGQRAVAQVVLNRVTHPAWPNSVCGVVYQGSERRTGCQFTFTCDGSLARRPGGASWARAQRIANEALSGSVYAPVGHATHYHALWVNPPWAGTLDHIGTIGAHRFYRLRGRAGDKSAFAMAYAGLEKGPALPVVAAPALPRADAAAPRPLIAHDLDPAPALPRNEAKPAAAPALPAVLANEAYGGAGRVRAEYARAGQWKVRPDTAAAPGE
ncbi:cell wall hydrolase [Erythrobacter tepidarius]|uniref:cell wall hydrolase n=1 Tax=Erythrobacter tepidarius TaxID=60454 RepID=UPI000A364736|nr:cell wall hydrolase [Erythrobacter tepidarius]